YVFSTTTCAVGCTMNFVLTDSWGDGWNGNTMNVTQNGTDVAVLGPTFTTGMGPITIPVSLCDGPFELFWNAGGSFSGEVGISVVNSFGQTIYVKAAGQGSPNSLLYSGVVDCSAPLCLPPNNLTATAVTTFGATLNWVANGPAPAGWDIYAVPAGQPAP